MSKCGWSLIVAVAVAGVSILSTSNMAMATGLSEADSLLVCQLSAAAENRDPSECAKDKAKPNSPLVEATCTCAPVWQCTDDHGPADLVTSTGSFLTQVNVRSGGCQIPEHICCFNIDTSLKPAIAPFTPSCGKRNTQGVVTNFVGFQNRESQFGEFPWMAAVMTSAKFGAQKAPLYICGGSLIHSQVVLTAAHYVYEKRTASELAVRLGEWNFKEASESVPHQEKLVKEILVHPDYIPSTLAYDFALLILEQPVQLGHTIDTICLPPANYDFHDHVCVVSGWGKDVFAEAGKYQQVLKSIELATVDHASCEAAMQSTRLGSAFHLHNTFMCAGGEEGKDACEGDGGSPLACHKPGDNSKYYQAGVVAWGIGCGQAGIPGVYADVTKAVPWIQETIIKKFSFDVRIGNK